MGWNLLEYFLGQVSTRYGLLEPHKLDDIALRSPIFVIFEELVVRVQIIHHAEFFVADANYDDRDRERGHLDDLFFGLFHVMDIAIGDDKQHEVGPELAPLRRKISEDIQDRGEECWSGHLNAPQILVVRVEDAVDAADLRLVKPPVQREAVIGLCFFHVARNAAKAESWKVFELVVRLQNVAHLFNGLSILIFLVEAMHGSRLSGLAVRGCKVDGYRERNLPA